MENGTSVKTEELEEGRKVVKRVNEMIPNGRLLRIWALG